MSSSAQTKKSSHCTDVGENKGRSDKRKKKTDVRDNKGKSDKKKLTLRKLKVKVIRMM